MRSRWILVLGLALLVSLTRALAADSAAVTNAAVPPAAEDATSSDRGLRALLQLQEQLHGALLGTEQARQEADAAARRNAETLAARLKMIEDSIAQQREREMDLIRGLNRLVLTAVAVFAGIGLIGLFCTGWLQLRALNRLAEAATAHPLGAGLGHGAPVAMLPAADVQVPMTSRAGSADSRLVGIIDRLERRIHEIEGAVHLPAPAETKAQSNGGHKDSPADNTEAAVPAVTEAPIAEEVKRRDQISLLIGKGQALLHLGQAGKALACFDEILAIEPQHSEAWVKKGTVLEHLDRLEEAIACYDHAIGLNQAMTLAYLQKGGVCNRLERFDEALRCYEQALKTQEKA